MSANEPTSVIFPCQSCGAKLEFAPGVDRLTCRYCGSQVVIAASAATVEEQSFADAMQAAEKEAVTEERLTAKCGACGAQTTLDKNVVSALCPYCGSHLSAEQQSTRQIKPAALLPFATPKDEALRRFTAWLKSRWFAPGGLKRFAQAGGLQGVYVPHWTFDSFVTARYSGERGDYYYVTETYAETVNGQQVTKTRQVRHTRWTHASGVVQRSFDDWLVLASGSLPPARAASLAPWDLEKLVPFQEEYLAGFKAESYAVGLQDAFAQAQAGMTDVMREDAKRDIGGDEQRIHSLSPAFQNVTFKHVLLPVWLSAYRYREKVYRFLVNARTGEVQGERPWSWWKIALAIAVPVAAAVVVGLLSR